MWNLGFKGRNSVNPECYTLTFNPFSSRSPTKRKPDRRFAKADADRCSGWPEGRDQRHAGQQLTRKSDRAQPNGVSLIT